MPLSVVMRGREPRRSGSLAAVEEGDRSLEDQPRGGLVELAEAVVADEVARAGVDEQLGPGRPSGPAPRPRGGLPRSTGRPRPGASVAPHLPATAPAYTD